VVTHAKDGVRQPSPQQYEKTDYQLMPSNQNRRLGNFGPSSNETDVITVEPELPSSLPIIVAQQPSPRRKLDIVIAHYNAEAVGGLSHLVNIPAVAERKPHWILYNKNADVEPIPQEKFTYDEVINLPNVGRESHTYLYHMVNRREDLADHIIFCQEAPHNMDTVARRLMNLFNDRTGFLSLSFEAMCSCEGCSLTLAYINPIYSMFRRHLCNDQFAVSLAGCFMVSRRRIETIPSDDLKYLLTLLEAPEDHFIHSEKYHNLQVRIYLSIGINRTVDRWIAEAFIHP